VRSDGWDKMGGSSYYRVYLPLREVGRQNPDIDIDLMTRPRGLSPDDLQGEYDIVIISRRWESTKALRTRVHQLGGVLVMDSDDDMTEDYRLVTGHGLEFRRQLSEVDYVTTSTQPLADLFGRYTRREPKVLLNYVDAEWMAKAARGLRLTKKLTIGFSGSPTHWGDWYIASVPFSRIVQEYDVVPILHGHMPDYLNFAAAKPLRIETLPYHSYPSALAQFDILLCGVDSRDAFNKSKSAVKALECMAVGAVPICSQFQPYVALAEAGAPIVLVEKESRAGWFEAMRELIVDEPYRLGLKARGYKWVKEHRDIHQGSKQWAAYYRKLLA